jgi:ectoine hydroxylase-related dioxygenase (phytanoyl-CoA dioxygenase family)
MMESNFSRYGIREQHPAEKWLDVHLEEIAIQGYTVLDSGLSVAELADLKTSLDRILNQQADEIGGPDILANIGEGNTVRALLAYDDAFLKLALHPTIQEICQRTLGPYFILMLQNATINLPSQQRHHQSAYHRDLPYQHFVSSRPLAMNALLCLDAFNAETGGTYVVPGSHKVEAFPSDSYVSKSEQAVVAPAGHFIVFDSMLYHRAGINVSTQSRYGINICYSIPILKQQISLPSLLQGKWSDDPQLARLLGYDSEPPSTVVEWRRRRLQRTAAGDA